MADVSLKTAGGTSKADWPRWPKCRHASSARRRPVSVWKRSSKPGMAAYWLQRPQIASGLASHTVRMHMVASRHPIEMTDGRQAQQYCHAQQHACHEQPFQPGSAQKALQRVVPFPS